MKKENQIYCIHCGTENKLDNKKCIKCHKKLNPKDRPLLNYLKSKITDELKGNIEDNIISIITNYIKSHLYGFILTCSVIASATCVIVNTIDNNYIEKVTEKPTIEQIIYSGTNLSSLEVAQTYVKAVEEGNTKIVESLQLENFHPEIIKEIEEYSQNNPNIWPSAALEHDFIDNSEILLKNKQNLYVGEAEIVSPSGNYGNYNYIGYVIALAYCSYNTCQEEDGRTVYDTHAYDELQLIEVEGNYYVLGEKVAIFQGQNLMVEREALYIADGDTTNLSFDEELQKYDSCNFDEECLKELGYTNMFSYY